MKIVKLLALLFALCLALSLLVACDSSDTSDSDTPQTPTTCDHAWQDATCDAPKTCSKCSATEGSALGHSWENATCDAPKTCSKCSATEGSALGHSWENATCDTPKTCTKCSATEGAALGHAEVKDVAVAPTCVVDGKTEGSHCSRCSEILIEQTVIMATGHAYEKGFCKNCNEPDPDYVPPLELKQMVSTDIVDFTLEGAKLTYYVSNVHSNYVEPTDKPNPLYAAKVGTCYVSMTFTVKNKDRGGSLNVGSYYWNLAKWTVTYEGETYPIYGYDLSVNKYPYINLSHGALIDCKTGETIKKIPTVNLLLSAGETATIRTFGIMHVDPTSLNDGFLLTVKVPNSKGEYEEFTYSVPDIVS